MQYILLLPISIFSEMTFFANQGKSLLCTVAMFIYYTAAISSASRLHYVTAWLKE